jgi:hypothetical protein
MREVPVPTGFAAHRRSRPARLIATWWAIWLIVLQAFLAGVVTARAGALAAAGALDVAVICHASGDGSSGDGATPDAAKATHLCCTGCTTSALATPSAPEVIAVALRVASAPMSVAAFSVIVPHGAIRAGPSQAPPPHA